MSDIKWIKIDTGLFNNRKIRQIEHLENSDALIVVWLKMMILAAEVNENGYLLFTDSKPYDAELLATQFNRPVELIHDALDTFIKYEMIDETISKAGTIYSISNWDKYQNIDGMERIREQNRLRKQRERDRKRDIEDDSHVTERDSHATDKEKDKDKEEDKEKNNIKKRTFFIPPTVDEVKTYCTERNNKIDAQTFIDFYESKGWMIGANKMKDWKAAIRTWEKRHNNDKAPVKKTQQHEFKQNDYDFADLEARILAAQRQEEKRHTV